MKCRDLMNPEVLWIAGAASARKAASLMRDQSVGFLLVSGPAPQQFAGVITDRDTGQSKGFGFVEFSNADEAKQAMSLNGTDFGGRALTVNEARPKNEGGGGGGRARY